MIKKISLQNYKKFKDLTEINFENGFNVLVGKNNAGKTTLLEVIRSFLDNDVKYFNDVKATNEFPDIEIETETKKYKLITSGKTWKWSDNIENAAGYISAHSSASEIEENINKFFKTNIKNNENITSEFDKEFNQFQDSLNLNDIATKSISETNDDYSVVNNIDIAKGIRIEFNKELPKSIINKGLGQQKEFLINYFIKKHTLNYTEYLLIDEIENSLSIESLRKIISNLKDNVGNKQIIVTSHNPETIGNKNFVKMNLVSIGIPPTSMMTDRTFFCEGPSDRKQLTRLFPNTLFIGAGGSTILDAARAYNEKNFSFSAVVDGDDVGKGYGKKIGEINKTLNIHILSNGTIEDYYDIDSKNKAIADVGLEPFNPFPMNFLQSSRVNKENRKIIKNTLERNGTFEDDLLKNEIKSFIMKEQGM